MRQALSRLLATRAHLRRPQQRDLTGHRGSTATRSPVEPKRGDRDRRLTDECGREWVVRQLPRPLHPALEARRGVALLCRCAASAMPPQVVRGWDALATLSDDDLLSRIRIAGD